MASTDMSRRALLKSAALLGGNAAGPARPLTQESPVAAKTLAAYRAQMAATPIEVVKLTNLITMFSGPGGNVVAWNEDGKVVVDTFVRGAFPGLKQHLDAMAPGELGRITPVLFVINTNWLYDYTGNNESFREAGAQIVAHENTKRRLSEPHELLGTHFNPAPAAAMPTRTFTQFDDLKFKIGAEEYIDLEYVPRAQTDTDIYVHFVMGDVMHLGGIFSNGMYPFIDADTGGSINGMIEAAEGVLKGVKGNRGTKIVPGYGPVADVAALMRYRDMLATVRDRVQKLKMAGRSEREVAAAKPTADLDAAWGHGFIQPEAFVSTVYKTL